MAKSKKSKSKKSKKETPAKLPKSLRKGGLPRSPEEVWAAGVGALAQARKTGSDSFDALVALGSRVLETGSGAAKTAVGQVEQAASAVTGTAREVAEGAAGTVQGGLEAVVEVALGKMGLPGRDEILALQAQVDDLQARVSTLKGATAPAPDAPSGAEVTAYEVAPHERGWAVRKAGAERATSVHKTKKEALRDGRQTARAHAPSTLTVFKTDGTVSEKSGYDAD